MNKIINGKKYNTDTAIEIASTCHEGDYKTLYRKKNGEFFFHYENSNYREESIRPIPINEAKSFAEDNLNGDEYEAVFGKVGEGDDVSILLVDYEPQLIGFFLDENKHPQAYQAKLQELIDSGMSEIDARKYIAHTPIQLELIYEVNEGFFAIEPDATECERYNSPYSKKLIKVLG